MYVAIVASKRAAGFGSGREVVCGGGITASIATYMTEPVFYSKKLRRVSM